MRAIAREEVVMDVLRTSGSASVAGLADTLDVTEATVRRTLRRLAEDGRVVRTYGGAAVATGSSVAPASTDDSRLVAKIRIGTTASGLVEDGSTIALSSGSTVLELARRLRDRRLTVITNALDVANVLLDAPRIELIVLGGVVLPGMHSMRGHLTEDSLRDLRADTVFMGASAIDLDTGFMTEQVREIAVDRALRQAAREAVILADSQKFGNVAPGFMFGFEQVRTIVTDDGLDISMRAALEERGVRVITPDTSDTQEAGTPVDIDRR